MKTAFIDCISGVTSGMLLGALLDIGLPEEKLKEILHSVSMHIPFRVHTERVATCGISASCFSLEVIGDAASVETAPYLDLTIEGVFGALKKAEHSERFLENAERLFAEVCGALVSVNGESCGAEIRLKEFTRLPDFLAALGCLAAFEELGLDSVYFSKIPVASAMDVESQEPCPDPLTAALLCGVPVRAASESYVEPLGIAVLRASGNPCPFGWHEMIPRAIGYGTEIIGRARSYRLVRLIIGDEPEDESESDSIWILEANVDDMTGEALGFALEKVFAAGALDVFFTQVYMKKNRPGILLSALCTGQHLERVEMSILTNTTTFGVRRCRWERKKLARDVITVDTEWGAVRVKRGFLEGKLIRFSPEYEDCKKIADKLGIPFSEVYDHISRLMQGRV